MYFTVPFSFSFGFSFRNSVLGFNIIDLVIVSNELFNEATNTTVSGTGVAEKLEAVSDLSDIVRGTFGTSDKFLFLLFCGWSFNRLIRTDTRNQIAKLKEGKKTN